MKKYEIENGALVITVYDSKDNEIASYEALTHGGWVGRELFDGVWHRFNGGDCFYSRREVLAHIKEKYSTEF